MSAKKDFAKLKNLIKKTVTHLSQLEYTETRVDEDKRLLDNYFRGLYKSLQYLGDMKRILSHYENGADAQILDRVTRLWSAVLKSYEKKDLDDKILMWALDIENSLRVEEDVSEQLKESAYILADMSLGL